MEQDAIEAVRDRGGDVKNRQQVLGQFQLQFGAFKGKTFLWMVENGLGYACYIGNSVAGETETGAPLSKSKFALREYLQSFTEGRRALSLKASEKVDKRPTTSASRPPQSPLAHMVMGRSLSPSVLSSRISKALTGVKLTPNLPASPSKTTAGTPTTSSKATGTGKKDLIF